MFKAKYIFSIILSLLITSLITTKVFARALTTLERKMYAQNNILFTTPCDSEEDCEGKEPTEYDDQNDDGDTEDDSDDDKPDDGGGSPGDPFTPSGSGAALIVSTARAMSWPTSAGTCRNSAGIYVGWVPRSVGKDSTPCQDTMSDYLRSIGQTRLIQDCGKFVGLVMRNTVDPNFQASGVKYQIPYMKKSKNWTKVSTDGQKFSMANLKPGDVLAFSENGHGHIMIWIGNRSVPCRSGSCRVNVASSSQNTRSPSLNSISDTKQCTANRECFLFQVFRWTGN